MEIYLIFSRDTVNIGNNIPERRIHSIYFSQDLAKKNYKKLVDEKGHLQAFIFVEYVTEDEPED